MGEGDRLPGTVAVARVALQTGLQMPAILTRRRAAVVTATAWRGGRVVIEMGRLPGTGAVTIGALAGGLEVSGVHALSNDAVVATGADLRDGPVIEAHGQPRDGAVTVIARPRGVHMIGRHPAAFARAMTLRATAQNGGVIHRRRYPGKAGVAIIAIILAVDVAGGFAGRDAAVVARGAHRRRALENTVLMAIGTGHFYMLAAQREAGIEVVECALILAGGQGRQADNREQQCETLYGCR